MRELNKLKVHRAMGCDPSCIYWCKGYVMDSLVINGEDDTGVTLVPANIRPKATVMISLSPDLLEMGATYTNIVEAGEVPLVFVPCTVADIPSSARIRGYVV